MALGGAYVDDDGFEDLEGLFHEDIQASAVPDDFTEPALEATQKQDDADSNGDGDEEPPWLMLDEPIEDSFVAAETQTRAEYLEALPEDSDRPVADLEDVCGQLMQYLIGHPSSLITKMRKFPGKKGSKSRYFGEERSDDVMADKVVTGCWACGKLDHESDECKFKRCFNCSAMGHQFYDCTVSKKEKCSKCKNPGHQEFDCPLIEYDLGIIKRNEDDPSEGEDGTEYTDLFFCRCANCGGDGHVNCAPVPISQIATPEVCVAAVPPGYEGSANGNGSWAVAPMAPNALLRPRGAPHGKLAPWAAAGNADNTCWDFLKTGFCHRGDACSYSHGEEAAPSKGGYKQASQPFGNGKGRPQAPSQPPPGYNGKGRPQAPSQPPPGYRAPSVLPLRPSATITPSKRLRSDSGEDWESLWEEEASVLEEEVRPQRPLMRGAPKAPGAFASIVPRPSVAIGVPRPSVAVGAKGKWQSQQYSDQQPHCQPANPWNNAQRSSGDGYWNNSGGGAGRWGGSGQQSGKRWKQSW